MGHLNKKDRRRRKYLADEVRRKINDERKNSIRAIAQIQQYNIDTLNKTDDELYKLWEDINDED